MFSFLVEHRAMVAASLAALISLCAYAAYIVELVGGRTKTNPLTRWMWKAFGLKGGTSPRLISWLIWMALTATTVVINVRDGSPSTAVLCGAYFLGNAALLIVSIRCGSWSTRWYDFVCLALGAVAVVLLFHDNTPRAATGLIVVADLIAGIPTFLNVIRKPEAESRVAWRIFFVGSLVNVFAFAHPFDPGVWGFVESAYTIYVIACTAFMVTLSTFQWRYKLNVTYEVLGSTFVETLPGGKVSVRQPAHTETEIIGFLTRWGRRRYLRNVLGHAGARSGTDLDESLNAHIYGDD